MRSHGLHQLVETGQMQVVNRLAASCQQTCCKLFSSDLTQVVSRLVQTVNRLAASCFVRLVKLVIHRLVTSCFNTLQQVCK